MSIQKPVVAWASGTNIYEVNVRQYTKEGTLEAFSKHMPRLKEMGVAILWFMPLTPISLEKRKGTWGSYYAARSYVDVDPHYGTAEDFRNLVLYAHSLELKVMIDWVANHTGYDHEWTDTYPQYYHKDEEGNFTGLHGWEDVIDLDYSLAEVRTAMIDSMIYWIREFDIDGFRCDMARTVPLDFWAQARDACDRVKPMYWLAECEIYEYHQVFDLTYGWEAMRALDKYFKNGEVPLKDIIEILKGYAKYPDGTGKLLFTSNHDENTYYGTEYEKYGDAALAVAVFTCTWPGVPLIYSGQELPNLKRLSFFEKDEIEWTGSFALHEFYRTLLHFRLQCKALQENAEVQVLETETQDVLVYLCTYESEKVLVLVNFSSVKKEIPLLYPEIEGTYFNLFTGTTRKVEVSDLFTLEKGGYLVYYSMQ